MNKKIWVVLFLFVMVLAACASAPEKTENFRNWKTNMPSLQQFLAKSLAPSREMDNRTKSNLEQISIVTLAEMNRLSQSGFDISLIPKPKNEKELKSFIDNLSGIEAQRAALTFWAVKEFFPEESIVYANGVLQKNLRRGSFIISHRLFSETNKKKTLGYFDPEQDFMILSMIKWDEAGREFNFILNIEGIKQISQLGINLRDY